MTVIFVKNIEVSKQFYQQLFGLNIKHDFGENVIFNDAFSLWQKKRAHQIIFEKEPDQVEKINMKNTELYFETDDLESIWTKIKQQDTIKIIHGIKEEQWGQRTIRIYDPDRFIIEIAEPMETVVRRLAQTEASMDNISQKTQLPITAVQQILNQSS